MSLRSQALASIENEWESFNKDFSEIEALQKTYSKTVSEMKEKELKCKKEITYHLKGIGRILQSLQCYRSTSDEEREKSKLKKDIAVREYELKDMLMTLPKDNGLYLNIVVGNIDVTLLQQDEKFRYKELYEKFKLNVTIVIFVVTVLHLIFLNSHALDAVLHFLLVWYYCTLTIRETILQVNGSRIKGWWRAHHFITTILAGILVLWVEGKSYQQFRKQFLWYSCYTSILQFMQYHYQLGCLYRLRCLGEGHNMEITVDGFHSWMWRGLKFLLPFLSIGYIWQLYNSFVLFNSCMFSEKFEWQVAVSAIMFFILFVGNSLTTATVVRRKMSEKTLILEKSKQ